MILESDLFVHILSVKYSDRANTRAGQATDALGAIEKDFTRILFNKQ